MVRPGSERRQQPRAAVLLSATMNIGTLSMPINVRNLSSGGALLQGEAFPSQGSTMLFARNGLSVVSRVIWADAERCGIGFEEAVNVGAAMRQIAPRKPVQARPCRRPTLKSSEPVIADPAQLRYWTRLGD